MASIFEFLRELVAIPSITPFDKGCQDLLKTSLAAMGFSIYPLPYKETDNFFAILGNSAPIFAFAGHTDVVPVGDPALWRFPPFDLSRDAGFLYGRGVADMKGALAAMIFATRQFLSANTAFQGSIAFLVTSAEEGPSEQGTPVILEYLKQKGITLDYCIVGEPSSEKALADVVKRGRRGSLTAHFSFTGKQGHVAYPHLATNPMHQALPFLTELSKHVWDVETVNTSFPSSSFQWVDLQSGVGASNVIPEKLTAIGNWRYSPNTSHTLIQNWVEKALQRHALQSLCEIQWQHYGFPYFVTNTAFLDKIAEVVEKSMAYPTRFSTTGGTSDARYIAAVCPNTIELGLSHATIHQVNECIVEKDLLHLTSVYEALLSAFLVNHSWRK